MKPNKFTVIILCFAALTVSAVVGICAGTVWLSPMQIVKEMFSDEMSQIGRIILYIRLPRVAAAVLAGAALSVSGAVIQSVLANPLAAPNIIGVNSGAGLFTVICAAFIPSAAKLIPAAAFLGAFSAVMIVYGIAKKTGASRMTIVLAGIGVSSLLNAVTDTLTTVCPDALIGSAAFKAGGFSGISAKLLFPAWILIVTGIAAAVMLSHDLDILALGDSTAGSLGMNTALMRFVFLAVAALLAGAAVSFSGLIGFVGLIVPHIARKITGTSENPFVIPVCALLGGAFLCGCDTIARTVFSPYELPAGIVVSYIGVPFFLWLLIRKKGEKHSA
ncbi:MAG: FecCD family ABC transporter permease [Oscillospiraceae bacterium]